MAAASASPTAAYAAPPNAVTVPIFDLESYRQVPGYADETTGRMGAWRTGVFDCLKDSIVPNCCMVTFCPPVSLAQICIRVNYSESYCGLLLLFVFPWFFAAITVALAVVPATSEWDTEPRQHLFLLPIAAGVVWFWQFAAVLTARRTVRKTFQIPEQECGEDVVLSLLCWPCVQAQVATHAKSYTPGSCSFARPDTLPPFQVY